MDKVHYNIGDVADILGESISSVRYWTDYFSQYVRPGRNSRGYRQYSAEDIRVLKRIVFLLKERKMSLEGAMAALAVGDDREENSYKVVEQLKELRQMLVDIHSSL